MYETALYEWKLTPDYINDNWTEELLALMFVSRLKRLRHERGLNDMNDEQDFLGKVRAIGGNIGYRKVG